MGKVLTTPSLSPFKFGSPFAKTAISLAIAATFSSIALPVDAAGLGRLKVLSALGQPLKAEIEITSLTEAEAESLNARLARPDAFRQAGLEYNPALTGLNLVVKRDGDRRSVVEITSPGSINEPFVDLLVELTWASGKFVREYTFLLDPPELRMAGAESVAPTPARGSAIVTPTPATQSPAMPAAAGATAADAAAAATAAAQASAQVNPRTGTRPVTAGIASASFAARADSLRDRRMAARAPGNRSGSTPSTIAAAVPAAKVSAAAAATNPALPTAAPTISATAAPGKRTVQSGETLAAIAAELTTSSDINKVMVALYRRNPDAFFGSIHQLRAGSELEVPSPEVIAAVSQADALAEIRTSNEAWQAYRNRLASVAADSAAPASKVTTGSAVVGNVGAARDTTGASSPASDSLKLSRDTTGVANGSSSAAGSSTVNDEERGVARQAALDSAQSRVTELERNVADLRKLLELKDQQLSDLTSQADKATEGAQAAATAAAGKVAQAQAQAQAATDKALAEKATAEQAARKAMADKDAAEKAAAEKVEAARLETERAATAKAEAEKAAAAQIAAAKAGATGTDATGADAKGADAASTKPGDAAGSVAAGAATAAGVAGSTITGAADKMVAAAGDAAGKAADAVDKAADSVGAAAADAARAADDAAKSMANASGDAAEAVTPAPSPAPQEEPAGMVDSLMASLTSNPIVPAGAAGLIALAGFFAWRKRKAKPAEEKFEDTLGGEDAFAANSLFGTTGGQAVDTSNSLFNTSVGMDSSVDVHSTEVDPIAEAEVYIAYGREAQAEEILKEALKRQPDRQAIRLKLLEIYAGRKDPIAYSALARDMYDATGGQNEEWPKVITMGLSIDPENPLYTGDGDVDAGSMPRGAGAAIAAAGAGAFAGGLGGDTRPGVDALDDDMPTLTVGAEAASVASAPAASFDGEVDAKADKDFGSLDFDLDINTEAVTGRGLSAESGDSIDTAMHNSIEMPSLSFDDDGVGESTAFGDVGGMNMEIPSVDSMRPRAGGSASDLELSSVGLDLSVEQSDGDGSGLWQEMATKLDLASAYEEIGDKEGARELLEEVVKDGDDGQQQKARAMLSKIS